MKPALRIAGFLACLTAVADAQEPSRAANVKVGEVTTNSALVWVRLTAESSPRWKGLVPGSPAWRDVYRAGLTVAEQARYDHNESLDNAGNTLMTGRKLPFWIATSNLVGSCAGVSGRARVRYGREPDLADARATAWAVLGTNADCAHTFLLPDLSAEAEYTFEAQGEQNGAAVSLAGGKGRFRTAPPPDRNAAVCFAVFSGQYDQRGDAVDPSTGQLLGFRSHDAMAKLGVDFVVSAGNMVYYDRGYWAEFGWSRDMARYRWQRSYGLPGVSAFHTRVPGYWAKGSHDTLKAACWPGSSLGALTWEQGLAVFREQVPMGERTYRTFRWGKALQVWITEARDFRSPNPNPDGSAKTLLGSEQKAWLKRTLLESDATWKVMISPTPVVGPDRELARNDNHAGTGFRGEGGELRAWFRDNLAGRFFVVCGETGWQQHSIDPVTGVQEFACGPLSDLNAGGAPRHDATMQKFVRTNGGFLTVTVLPLDGQGSRIAFRFHDVDGKELYEAQWAHAPGTSSP